MIHQCVFPFLPCGFWEVLVTTVDVTQSVTGKMVLKKIKKDVLHLFLPHFFYDFQLYDGTVMSVHILMISIISNWEEKHFQLKGCDKTALCIFFADTEKISIITNVEVSESQSLFICDAVYVGFVVIRGPDADTVNCDLIWLLQHDRADRCALLWLHYRSF